ncbi:ABC transporter substrate-binding protein [Oceanicella actignis]|uniref:NitT/TauT family transport system substrate-binding protein n=1 Tax=Oceanicella actignis TaxID=1189325 RepID=A0A1M7TVS5_9RHOB|nr:ABC transporter substrate-binding protein [Oceanicella actignis]TYO90442.1 NitT/TauT family transport system substrate-binding protein [Oceanicella actignis]SES80408.1 NitT/TauT family transport system substrate-binding protein [Oceanicella actignis]SHN74733.1 NitT/TauT family transport system substrate-binding protein [Oceanicella actignis]
MARKIMGETRRAAAQGWTRRAALGLAAGLGLGLAMAAGAAAAAEKVAVGALRFTSHAPTFIAYERGYFADEGLDVELKFFQAAQPVAVAVASGDVDFGVTALTGGFFSLADKGAVRVIGGLMSEHPDHDGSAVLVSNKAWDEGVRSMADLRGRSFALTQFGSSFHYMAGRIAEANGFALEDMRLVPLQKVGAMIGALKSGQVDAMAIVPHIARPLDAAGAAHIVGWVRDLGPYQVTTIFTSAANTTERPELVRRFMRAYARGIADYRAVMLDQDRDPAATEAMVDLIHKYVYADRPREKAAPSIKAGAVHLNAGAALDVADVERQLTWFKKHGLAPAGLTMDKLVDPRFQPAGE